jgi:Short C-terminal domain
MDCVCGCEREISGVNLTQRNFIAARVALELLAWDKNRASPTPGPEGREGLIARGADCYQRLLYSLHEEGSGDPDADCDEWLSESADMRAQRSDMTTKRFLGRGPGSPNLSEHDMAQLDRLHPELSFTGKYATQGGGQATMPAVGGQTAAAAAAAANDDAAPGDDLVDKLERLRALRDDGMLTDDEFAAAKARLLG